MKIKWLKKAMVYLRRYFSPNVRISVISPKEEIKPHLVSFYGDTYSLYNKNSKGKIMKEPEIKLVFRRYRLKNYIDIIVHPNKI